MKKKDEKKPKEHIWGGYKFADQLLAAGWYGVPILFFFTPLFYVAREVLDNHAMVMTFVLAILLMLGWGLTLYNRDHIQYLKQENDKLKAEIEELKKNLPVNKD